MQEYQKIETLYKFDNETKRFVPKIYNPIVEYLSNCPWLVSEKIDGTNIRVRWDGHKVEWSGRTDKSDLPKEVAALLQEKFGDAEIVFEQLFADKDVILFMECYGGKIQGGLYGGKERLIGFDVMVNGTYLDKLCIHTIFQAFGIPTVPFYIKMNLQECIDIVNNYNESSRFCQKGTTQIEGLVCVPTVRLYDHMGHRIIIKIKKKDLRKLAE